MTVGEPPGPAVFFLSDYGTADEFVGVVHAVLHRLAATVPVIDLSHQIPPFDVAAGAALLVRAVPYLGAGVVLAVVDPGVGTARRAVAVRTGSGSDRPGPHRSDIPAPPGGPRRGPSWLVGPDNGLLVGAAEVLGGAEAAVALRVGRDARHGADGRDGGDGADGGDAGPGPTFDGRDVFAPAAAHLALGGDPTVLGEAIAPGSLVAAPGLPTTSADDEGGPDRSAVVAPVVWIDRFGNVQLALGPRGLDAIDLPLGATGELTVDRAPGSGPSSGPQSSSGPHRARRVRAFGELAEGELGLVVDSSGQVAVVLDRASAAERLDLAGTGAAIRIVPGHGRRG